MHQIAKAFILLYLFFSAGKTYSHHGFLLYFDPSDQVRIEGVLHEVKIRNPHSELQVEVISTSGESEIWTCETQARTVLTRKGFDAQDFKIGEKVVIVGARGRRDPMQCQTSTIELADGRLIEVRSATGVAAIGLDDGGDSETNTSVFGSWIRNIFVGEPVEPGFLDKVTEAGRQANAKYDPFTQDPPLLCRPGSPPRAWVAPGQPTNIRQEGDRILIQHEFMDFTREVHMNGTGQPDLAPDSEMGYSVGHFEGETLIVTSTNFVESTLLTHVEDSGLMHSDALRLTETYKVNSETGELEYGWVAEDPKYFSAPISGSFSMTPTDLVIGPFNCEVLIDIEVNNEN